MDILKSDGILSKARTLLMVVDTDFFRCSEEAGAAMLTPESVTGGERKLIGSVMAMSAEKIEDVRAIIEEDIYYTSGVVRRPNPLLLAHFSNHDPMKWDPEVMVIAPLLAGVGFNG